MQLINNKAIIPIRKLFSDNDLVSSCLTLDVLFIFVDLKVFKASAVMSPLRGLGLLCFVLSVSCASLAYGYA